MASKTNNQCVLHKQICKVIDLLIQSLEGWNYGGHNSPANNRVLPVIKSLIFVGSAFYWVASMQPIGLKNL